jgi:glycosyltransferase involved in cell wall biosynthesis
MTVIHVETGKHLYGGALQVFYLLRGLANKPMRNVLVCPGDSAIAKTAHEVADKVYEMPIKGDLDFPFIGRLKSVIKEEQADLVHLHSRRGADVLGGIAARLSGVKCICSRRVDNPENPFIAKIKYRLYDRVITISSGIRSVLLNEGIPADKIACVHSAVDAAKFKQPPDRVWFENEFDLPPGSRALGVVAQLIRRKGHLHLLAALPDVIAKHPDIRVLLFGKGPMAEELQQKILWQGLKSHVRLIGFREDLHRVLPNLYAVIHPADMEGLGVSLLQAAAAGVPLIGTRAGGIPEIVRNEQNGLLIDPQNVDQLQAAMLRLLANDAQAHAWGEAGRKIVQTEFSIDAMVEGNFRIYRSLLGQAGIINQFTKNDIDDKLNE